MRTATEKTIRSEIEKQADVTATDGMSRTPLHLAASYNTNADVASLLIDQGADINAVDAERPRPPLWHDGFARGQTPLHKAAIASNMAVAKLLLSRGADVKKFDSIGQSPLHKVAAFSQSNFGGGRSSFRFLEQPNTNELLELLLVRGSDVNLADRKPKGWNDDEENWAPTTAVEGGQTCGQRKGFADLDKPGRCPLLRGTVAGTALQQQSRYRQYAAGGWRIDPQQPAQQGSQDHQAAVAAKGQSFPRARCTMLSENATDVAIKLLKVLAQRNSQLDVSSYWVRGKKLNVWDTPLHYAVVQPGGASLAELLLTMGRIGIPVE